jgi:hypothetical protein
MSKEAERALRTKGSGFPDDADLRVMAVLFETYGAPGQPRKVIVSPKLTKNQERDIEHIWRRLDRAIPRSHTAQGFDTQDLDGLVVLLRSSELPTGFRMAAAREILDRSFGRSSPVADGHGQAMKEPIR